LTDDKYSEEVQFSTLIGGDDELPEGSEDIRGCIQNSNGLDVYVREADDYEDTKKYFGIKVIDD
jgi:L-fucose mutarotase/ribose pyranase (RbsD/FucU family)